jgi:hypothetical protein
MEISGAIDEAARPEKQCFDAGCDAGSGIRCNYTDWRGRHCPTTWCFAHWVLVRGKPYCRRHATVMGALDAENAIGGLPDIDNRAASLAGWMGKELEAAVRHALKTIAPAGARLISEPLRPALTPGAGRRWQRAWTVSDDTGVLSRVSLEVEEQDDVAIVVRVDGEVIGQGVPPWIGRDATAESVRRAFRDAIAESISLVLSGREVVISA